MVPQLLVACCCCCCCCYYSFCCYYCCYGDGTALAAVCIIRFTRCRGSVKNERAIQKKCFKKREGGTLPVCTSQQQQTGQIGDIRVAPCCCCCWWWCFLLLFSHAVIGKNAVVRGRRRPGSQHSGGEELVVIIAAWQASLRSIPFYR